MKGAALFLSEDVEPQVSLLSEEENSRLAGMSLPGRREQFIRARTLLHLSLEKLYGRPAASFPVSAQVGSGPSLPGGPFLSLSHTKGLVACLISFDGPCGVDIEDSSAQRDFEALSRHSIEGPPARSAKEFYEAWCLREARIKQPTGSAALFMHKQFQGALVLSQAGLLDSFLYQGSTFKPQSPPTFISGE